MNSRQTPFHLQRWPRDLCITILMLAILVLLSGCGISGNKRFDHGFADFDVPSEYRQHKSFGLSLGRLPLSIARWAVDDDDDPEAAAMLRGLKAMRVYVYEVDNGLDTLPPIDSVGDDLEAEGWTTVVKAHDGEGHVRIMLRLEDDGIAGMAVIVSEPREAILVNLIGDFPPTYFNQAMAGMDLGVDVQLDDQQVEQVRLAQVDTEE